MPDSEATSLNLVKLQNPVKDALEDVHKDLEEVRKHQVKYSKLLDKVPPYQCRRPIAWLKLC